MAEYLVISLDGGPQHRTTDFGWERPSELDPTAPGRFVQYVPGPEVWTVHLNEHVGEFGRTHRAEFTADGRTYPGSAVVDQRERGADGLYRTTLIVTEIRDASSEAPPAG